MIRTAILGASGYVGGELLRLIAAHPVLVAAKLYGESKAGQKLGAVHPHLAGAYSDAVVEKFDCDLDGVDLVFAALPHGHSQRVAAGIRIRGSRSSTSARISGSTTRRPTSAGTETRTRRRSC